MITIYDNSKHVSKEILTALILTGCYDPFWDNFILRSFKASTTSVSRLCFSNFPCMEVDLRNNLGMRLYVDNVEKQVSNTHFLFCPTLLHVSSLNPQIRS